MISKLQYADKQEIKLYQEQKFKELLQYLNTHSSFYKSWFEQHHIDVCSIQSLDNLTLIPPVTKKNLQEQNQDFYCVDTERIVEYATTSGTLGNPVNFVLSDSDLERLAYNEAVSLSTTGITAADKVQLMTTMDRCFLAGLAYYLGLRKLGAGVVRVGASIPQLQWDMILKNKPDYLIAVPSFIVKMIDYAEEHHIDYKNIHLKGIICIGEAIRNMDFSPNTLHQRIAQQWNVPLYSTYASTEMSTAFTECQYHQGGHQIPELIYIEVLDTENKPVEDGCVGELTITTFGVEAMPLLRFKTGDMLVKYSQPCSCGRNSDRISAVLGRKEQMIKLKGTTIYPNAIIEVLKSYNQIKLYQIVITHNDLGTDQVQLNIAIEGADLDFSKQISTHLQSKLRVLPMINIVDYECLTKDVFPISSRKPIYVLDKRKPI
ncbi:MAG: AMP-binding protein [Bacteroidota bacterium]|nr:AMP-binding protein [Bacteroidota bacterium]